MGYPSLSSRVDRVRERIASAAARAGRPASEVTLVAVTKTHPPAAVAAALAAGLREIAENRVQELESKVAAAGRDAARWHLIGHLQRNKVRRALELSDLIHSVDSLRLARKLGEEATASGGTAEVLVQVNVSGEETKGGFEGPSAVEEIAEVCALPGLRVVGLMTMAPFTEDEGVLRRVFSTVRSLRDEVAVHAPEFEPRHLSMGMSGDYEVAVEEGSTMVRLGTVLFGERTP